MIMKRTIQYNIQFKNIFFGMCSTIYFGGYAHEVFNVHTNPFVHFIIYCFLTYFQASIVAGYKEMTDMRKYNDNKWKLVEEERQRLLGLKLKPKS